MIKTLTREEITQKLVARAWQDESFKKDLLKNSKAAIAAEGICLPESIELRVVEETPNTVYLVLPAKPTTELLEEELESVAGGIFDDWFNWKVDITVKP